MANKMTSQDYNHIAIRAWEWADKYKIRLAPDLEEFSRHIHEAVEEGIFDYINDNKDDYDYENLKMYETQYE